MFDFEKEGDGRYVVYLSRPRTRLGMVLGKPEHWIAETPRGFQLPGAFRTRKEAANALLSRRAITFVSRNSITI
jgi:hypothetical protein